MPKYVVDASIIGKWILPGEPYQEKALKVKEDFVSGRIALISLNLVTQEIANTLWKAIKLARISETDARQALTALSQMGIQLHGLNWSQASQALVIACNLNLTAYDASYIILSENMRAPLITADQTLYETAKKRFNPLHIKDYS